MHSDAPAATPAPTRPEGGPRGHRPTRPRMRNLQRRGWLSDQHGAWTMMALPPLLGLALAARFSWPTLLMLVAWAMAFQTFSATCLWVKTPAKRRGRIVPALATYGVLTAIPGIALLVARPQTLWWAILFAPLALFALLLVWRGRERSLGARTASILAGGVMGPVAFSLASSDGSPGAVSARAWVTCAAFALHYVGTVPVVRSMIRGRRDPRWAWGATAFHAACALGTLLAWRFGTLTAWPVVAWVGLTVRAWVMPTVSRAKKRPLSPKLIGFTEIGWTALLFASLLIP
ncbi:YwiC-like family protein [Schaalia meyeri]|nr:YwiC-like family protein [Schaalia meyeri]